MTRIITGALLVSATLGIAQAGSAQGQDNATPALTSDRGTDNGHGLYVAVEAGLAATQNVDLGYYDEGGTFGGAGATDTALLRADVKSAFTVGGAIGYDFGLVRADIQVDYTRGRIRSLTLNSINGAAVPVGSVAATDVCDYLELNNCSVSGNTIRGSGYRIRQISALANIWLDIPTGSVVTPYAGGGIGVGGYEVGGEGKARFAWQLGAGVGVALSPSVAVTGDFRHRQIGSARFSDGDRAGTIVGKVKANTFTAGLRFRF